MQDPHQSPGLDGFEDHLRTLRSRLELLHGPEEPGRTPRAEVVADLETAYEELRVADEELRAQQFQIAGLLEEQQVVRHQHERMLAALPVPALITDQHGTIRSANAAAAALVEHRVPRLLGRPAFSLFEPDDRRSLRQQLVQGATATGHRLATIGLGSGGAVQVEVSITSRPGAEPGYTWLLLVAFAPGPSLEVGRLADALTQLAGLPTRGTDVQDLLNQAVRICRRALAEPDLSVCIGSPDRPERTASTSAQAQRLDGVQVASGEGPGHLAFATRSVVVSENLATDERWPHTSRSSPVPASAAVAAPIEVGDRLMGVLGVYLVDRSVPATLPGTVQLLAASLGAMMQELELNEELSTMARDMQQALDSRATIDQAKGVVMSQLGCGPDEAYAHLLRLSSAQERKVRDVAHTIVAQATAHRAG